MATGGKNQREKTKQPAKRGLLSRWLPMHVIQPLLIAIIVANAASLTVWQYNQSHSFSVISKIPAPAALTHQPISRTKVMARSLPVHLGVPAAGVDTDLITIGRQADGSIELPKSYDIAGWYTYSPTPGELGPAIIVGHVDSYKGLGVFWYLKDLKPNDQILVSRTDGSVADFAVTKVEEVSQDSFPTNEVYGPINYAGIRLITCGGEFSHATGRYNHNIVVFGKLQ
jgi:sortase (surface protein transpeptidase)